LVVGVIHRDAFGAEETLHPHGVATTRSSNERCLAVALRLLGVDAIGAEYNLHAGGIP